LNKNDRWQGGALWPWSTVESRFHIQIDFPGYFASGVPIIIAVRYQFEYDSTCDSKDNDVEMKKTPLNNGPLRFDSNEAKFVTPSMRVRQEVE